MSEDTTTKSSAGKGLGIAGFVLGLLALIFSFVPCLGMYAMFPGIIAIILAAVAFMQANKGNGPKGLIIAALVVSVIGTGVAIYQYMQLKDAVETIGDGLQELENMDDAELEQAFEDAFSELEEELENEMDEEDGGEEN